MSYLLIALIATTIGALSGVGGGVIIKPILDVFSSLDARSISLISSFTVLSMAITSIIRHIKYKTPFKKRIAVLLAIGAVIGGLLGEGLLSTLTHQFDSSMITIMQNIGLLCLLVIVLVYMNIFKEKFQFHIQNSVIIISSGIILGILSTLLGIGGGPINIVALTLLFSMDAKNAAVNSIILILFSQASKILNIGFTTGFSSYELFPLLYMIPASILGGYLGSRIYKRISNKQVLYVFNSILVFIIGVNIFNIIR